MKGQNSTLPEERHAEAAAYAREYAITPRADVHEGQDGAKLYLDMPGVDEKSLDIRVERNVLTVSGRVNGLQKDSPEMRLREFSGDSVSYRRIFTLSDELDIETIDASIKNGVLALSIPKTTKAQSRKIEVRGA